VPTRFKKINGSKFSYSILAKTVYGLAFAPPAMGITVKNVSSKSTKITPDCSLVVQRVTHSPIFFAPCHAAPVWFPFCRCRAVMMAVSVVLPSKIIFTIVFSAVCICSASTRVTIWLQHWTVSRYISGADERAESGVGAMMAASCSFDTLTEV
jgi:hypothetical protein